MARKPDEWELGEKGPTRRFYPEESSLKYDFSTKMKRVWHGESSLKYDFSTKMKRVWVRNGCDRVRRGAEGVERRA